MNRSQKILDSVEDPKRKVNEIKALRKGLKVFLNKQGTITIEQEESDNGKHNIVYIKKKDAKELSRALLDLVEWGKIR